MNELPTLKAQSIMSNKYLKLVYFFLKKNYPLLDNIQNQSSFYHNHPTTYPNINVEGKIKKKGKKKKNISLILKSRFNYHKARTQYNLSDAAVININTSSKQVAYQANSQKSKGEKGDQINATSLLLAAQVLFFSLSFTLSLTLISCCLFFFFF